MLPSACCARWSSLARSAGARARPRARPPAWRCPPSSAPGRRAASTPSTPASPCCTLLYLKSEQFRGFACLHAGCRKRIVDPDDVPGRVIGRCWKARARAGLAPAWAGRTRPVGGGEAGGAGAARGGARFRPPPPPLGFVISMEGADPILDPDQLPQWWEVGLRLLGLTHYGPGR